MKLTGKWALVTGSTRGIGQQIAVALAKQGCNIVVHGRSLANTKETVNRLTTLNVDTKTVAASLDSQQGVQELIEFVQNEIGTPDIIYNNAGIQNEWVDTFDNDLTVWQKMFQVNLFSVIQICNTFIPQMIEKRYGRVINTVSDIDLVPEMTSYGAAKEAVRKMTREFAVTLKDTGVTITALDPSWVSTDLGGPDAPNSVESVVPGALAPVISDLVENGAVFSTLELQKHPALQ